MNTESHVSAQLEANELSSVPTRTHILRTAFLGLYLMAYASAAAYVLLNW